MHVIANLVGLTFKAESDDVLYGVEREVHAVWLGRSAAFPNMDRVQLPWMAGEGAERVYLVPVGRLRSA